MVDRVDVIVLGVGGFGGACLARLARRGVSVLGVDAFLPGHDRGSSHGDTRIIRQAYFEHPDYVPLLRRSYEMWSELESETGRSLMTLCGLALAGPPESSEVAGSRLAAKLHKVQLDDLSSREAAERLPGFRIPDGFEVIYEPRAGFLLVEECVRSQVDRAVQAGAHLRIGERIEGWSSDGRTVTVKTDHGLIEAGSLIVTAGAWASGLLAGVAGIPSLQVLRKVLLWHPVRTQDYSIDRGGCGFLFDMPEGTFYGVPSLDGKTLKLAEHSGGQVVVDPLKLDRRLLPSDVAPVSEFVRTVMPSLDPEPSRHMTCMYTMSPDGHFIVDRHPGLSNVVFGAGFSGHGFKFAPVIGEALADLALDGTTELPIGFLGLNRFERDT
jgi:sarcosine oxidase